MTYTFSEIVDLPAVQRLLDQLWLASGIPAGIIGCDGTILLAAGWQEICTRYHRQHPGTAARCRESDAHLTRLLHSGAALPDCGYVEYRCANGMIDIGIPIVIEGNHLANYFLGQFFYEPPDEESFRRQAREFGFDEDAYLTALRAVPIFSTDKVRHIIDFNRGLVSLLTTMGVEHLRQLQAAAEHRQAEEKFRALFELCSDGIGIVAQNGAILEVNVAFCKLLGYRREELLQLTIPQLLAPERADDFAHYGSLVAAQGELIFTTEYRHKGGETRPVEISARAFNYGGEPAFLATTRDIRERKRIEAELVRAKEAAEAASRAKSEFLANMSHEIRTPLTSIIALMELLQFDGMDVEHAHYLQLVGDSTDSLLQMINDILDLSKIEAGRLTSETSPFSLHTAIDEVVDGQRHLLKAKGLNLTLALPADLPDVVAGDRLRFKQVLLNLLGNAIKFTQNGSIAIAANVPERTKETITLRVCVSDTGIGIRVEDLERIFLPFEQVDMSASRSYGGAGLGLAICRRLVDLMGGSLAAESRWGEGSTFCVTLPFTLVGLPVQESVLGDMTSAAVTSPPLTILAVEDNSVNRQILALLLGKFGHQVEVAENGVEALKKLNGQIFDLILMDIQMPVMDGVTALQRIREQETRLGWRTPIVALTAHALAGDRESVLALGFDGYLPKPIRIEELCTILDQTANARPQPSALQ